MISSTFPYITKFIIDDVLVKQQLQNLKEILLVTVLLVLSLIPINVAVGYFSSQWVQLSVYDLRQKIGEHFLSSKENSKDNGLFTNTIISDSDIIGNQLLSIVLNSVPNILLTVLYAFVLMSLNLKLMGMILLIIPLFLLMAFVTSRKIFSLSKDLQKYRDKLIGFLNSYVRNKLLIDLYELKEEEKEKFSSITQQVKQVNVKTNTILSFLNNITGLLTAVIPLSCLLVGSIMVVHHELSLGSLIAFNSYLALLFAPLGTLLNIPALFSEMKVSISRVEHSISSNEEK
jgi:ABC-type bacteriocin/lantibiotic exporter with double-glycine peptidase domain